MSSKISPIKEEEQEKPEKKHKLSFVQGFSNTVDEEDEILIFLIHLRRGLNRVTNTTPYGIPYAQ